MSLFYLNSCFGPAQVLAKMLKRPLVVKTTQNSKLPFGYSPALFFGGRGPCFAEAASQGKPSALQPPECLQGNAGLRTRKARRTATRLQKHLDVGYSSLDIGYSPALSAAGPAALPGGCASASHSDAATEALLLSIPIPIAISIAAFPPPQLKTQNSKTLPSPLFQLKTQNFSPLPSPLSPIPYSVFDFNSGRE